MVCEICKHWCPLMKDRGKGAPSLDENGHRLGWCRKESPERDRDGEAVWPKSIEVYTCGCYQPIKTEIGKAQAATRYWHGRFRCINKNNNLLVKKIRDIGELLGISRRKQPLFILKKLVEALPAKKDSKNEQDPNAKKQKR